MTLASGCDRISAAPTEPATTIGRPAPPDVARTPPGPGPAARPRILAVLSYRDEYPWQAGVLRGIEATLEGRAELELVRLDVADPPDEAAVAELAERVVRRILESGPDAVITADDRATRKLARRLRDHAVPVAFCGVSWPVASFELPEPGTGMLQRAPERELLEIVHSVDPGIDRLVYVAGDRLTDRVTASGYRHVAAARGLHLDVRLVRDFAGWARAVAAESAPGTAVLLANVLGIADWDETAARDVVRSARGLLLAHHEWMAPLATVTITHCPLEHGEWAAMTALELAAGVDPATIPVLPNVRFRSLVNPGIPADPPFVLPTRLRQRSVEVSG